MALKPFQEKIIRQLIQQENMLSELYQAFAGQFPPYEKFWKDLSREEIRHAKLLEKLYAAATTGKIFFDEGKIKTVTLNAFLSRLEDIVKKAKNHEYTLSGALTCAMDYETSLIEKNIFTHFDSLNHKVKGTLKILQSETMNHVDRVRKAKDELSSH
jgi:rubrerythrin